MKKERNHSLLSDGARHLTNQILWLSFCLVLFQGPQARSAELKAMDDYGKIQGPFVSVDAHISLFSDIAEASMLAGSFGYGARGGYRWNSLGLLLTVEHNMWIATEYESSVVQGAVNIGVGGDFIYGRGLVRTTLAVGPSILAYDTTLDDAGSTGIFLDVRPVGLRWAANKYLVIGLDPISFAMVMPVLGGIPLVYIQYRTSLYLEAAF